MIAGHSNHHFVQSSIIDLEGPNLPSLCESKGHSPKKHLWLSDACVELSAFLMPKFVYWVTEFLALKLLIFDVEFEKWDFKKFLIMGTFSSPVNAHCYCCSLVNYIFFFKKRINEIVQFKGESLFLLFGSKLHKCWKIWPLSIQGQLWKKLIQSNIIWNLNEL